MSSPLIEDLKLSLIKNTSDVEFLTSDYPVIRYNLWSIIRKLYSGWGMCNVGLMFFLPISPKFALIAYDPVIYKIKNLQNNVVSINNKSAINEINSLMLLNSNENLFFSPNIPLHYIKRLISHMGDYMKPHDPITVFGSGDHYYVLDTVRKISYKANLSFITILQESLDWPVPKGLNGLLRPASEAMAKRIKQEFLQN